ncbi:PilN domain-containing protein [Motiliproteus sp. MSK22-1]|uniref:PilN domain-containing protein n=1 Tax=Motiliproteus sp. MSK22-1 TaxID=1897630 RepID=UPI0009768709|nr:PilN domain-containing protein [Motiliproteus sp. MSK22-1]OMH28053.1 pilus assembly protein PilN [Motiliproteus sp. MSK22-1]
MANTLINLRPWREDRRKDRQQRFSLYSLLFVILAGAVVYGAGAYIESQTIKQKQRNDYLRQEMANLDSKIKEIKELKEKRARLLERLQAIQDLQGNRPVIVRVFDELVRVLPEELYYTSLSRSGNILKVNGSAQANKDVSQLMRSLNRSPWFGEPNLSSVGQGEDLKNFNMQVSLSKPKPEEGS